ncbi:MAG: acyl-CoA thioesterase [Bacteroidia bacterium]
MTSYPLKLKLRIDWSEMDLYAHVNNVTYFKYIQAGRVNYWETLGLTSLLEKYKQGPILASTACNFRKPLFYPGNAFVETGVESVGETSFTILHRILNDEGEVAAEAKDIVVFYDFANHTKMVIPEEIRELIEKVEKGN